LGEVEANESDLSDATPLGPMTTEPVPGGDAGVPPSGVCEGGVLVRVIGKIGEMENAIVEKGVDWTIPLTPPDGLGLDDGWNGASISFYVECPTGETQYAEPIFLAEPSDRAFGYSGPISATVTVSYQYQLTGTNCETGEISFTQSGSNVFNFAISNFVALWMATSDGSGGFSPGSGGPGEGAGCGASGMYRRNGVLQGSRPDGSTFSTSVWGSNRVLSTNVAYSGSHSSSIDSIVLTAPAAGIGETGDDVTQIGLDSNTPYPYT
jgi:hypothetical protein